MRIKLTEPKIVWILWVICICIALCLSTLAVYNEKPGVGEELEENLKYKTKEDRKIYEENKNKPSYQIVEPDLWAEEFNDFLEKRDLGERISYVNHTFYFTYKYDPELMFQNDTKAQKSCVLATQLRRKLTPMGFGFVVQDI